MSSISSGDIISILKSEIENFDFDTRDKEVGTVIWVGDGIVTIYGIDNAMYGEIVAVSYTHLEYDDDNREACRAA